MWLLLDETEQAVVVAGQCAKILYLDAETLTFFQIGSHSHFAAVSPAHIQRDQSFGQVKLERQLVPYILPVHCQDFISRFEAGLFGKRTRFDLADPNSLSWHFPLPPSDKTR